MKSAINKTKVKRPIPIYLIILFSIVGIVAIYLLISNWTQIIETFGGTNHSGMIKITRSPWSGWNIIQPKDATEYIPVEWGKEISLKGLSDSESYNLYIGEVSEDSIKMREWGLFLAQGEAKSGGINLMSGCSLPYNFTIQRGETVELSTCTMDMGITWYITYVR